MMVQRLCTILLLVVCAATLAFADAGRTATRRVVTDEPASPSAAVNVAPTPDKPTANPLVGTYTGVSGFYDYQTNGMIEMIRVNPANGNIHTIMMIGIDSVSFSAGRRTGYALSSDGGASWNTFNNLLVPNRRSGFPSLDLGQGPIAGAAIIANHSTITGTQSTAFVDYPEGSGAFAEIGGPPGVEGAPGGDEPIWPAVAGASDGSVVMMCSRSSANTDWIARTTDYTAWAPWIAFPDSNDAGGRYPTISNGNGHVGVLLNGTGVGVWWLESTDNGATWPAHPVKVFGAWPVDADSIAPWVGEDVTYNGNEPMAAYDASLSTTGTNGTYADTKIVFWSRATGLVNAVPHDTTLFISSVNAAQTNTLTLGYPAIAMSGSNVVIVFQAMQADTSVHGFNLCDIWITQSANGGATWSKPVNITNTKDRDERYPSVSKYNAPGVINIVYQEKIGEAGTYASSGPDNANVVRARQVYLKYQLTGVGDKQTIPTSFSLDQNFPNPFNPATKIDYTVSKSGPVSIKVYNTIGQEVATLVNEVREAGHYQVTFDGSSLASGMYMYRMQAGNFVESKKMLFLK